MTRYKLLAKRTFRGVTWKLERGRTDDSTRPGTWYRLGEHGGQWRTDYPTRYESGKVAYDRPEALPAAVRRWVEAQLAQLA